MTTTTDRAGDALSSLVETINAQLDATADTVAEEPETLDPTAFLALGISESLVRALMDLKIHTPTPVQAQAIPAALAGKDLLVSSQTGSGKTAAFMLPALQKIADRPATERPDSRPARANGRRPRPGPAKPQLIVLTPTRELAQQVTSATSQFGKYLKRIVCVSIVGGMPYPRQLEMLAKMPEILVATPGRLLDHMGSGRIDLSELSMLVFDEADRMLDMGFSEDIDAIIAQTPEHRQTLMFSATVGGRIPELAAELLNDPVRITIEQQQLDYKRIEQRVHFVDDAAHKAKLLAHVLDDDSLQQAIIFTGTKLEADELADELIEQGHAASALHGDMKQSMRNRTLQGLRRGEIKVLVATDVAARGIDVPNITHVVNYALPRHSEDYIHRIGRTGRAGRSGIAINLVHHGERFKWTKIERMLPGRVEASEIAGLEPQRAPKRREGGFNSGGGYNNGGKERWSKDRRDRASTSRSRFERDDRVVERGNFDEKKPHGGRDEFRPRFDDQRPRFDRDDQRPRFGDRKPAWEQRGDSPRPAARRTEESRPSFEKNSDAFENRGNTWEANEGRPARRFGRDDNGGGYRGARDSRPQGEQAPRRFGERPAAAARTDSPRPANRDGADARRGEWQDRPRRTSTEWVRR